MKGNEIKFDWCKITQYVQQQTAKHERVNMVYKNTQ